MAANSAELQDRIDEAVNSFIGSHVNNNGTQPPQNVIDEATARISQSITDSFNNRAERNDRLKKIIDALDERRAVALAEARTVGVMFIHDRATLVSEQVLEGMDGHSKNTRLLTVLEERNIDTHGGRTLAYAYEIGDEGELYMVVAVAHCRSDEAYCEVIGMEQSLQHFADGHTITIPITHERLGPGKLAMISNEFKAQFHSQG